MCIKELWDDMSRKVELLKELHSLVKALNKIYKGLCKFLIDNKQNLCEHGGLHPMTERKGKYIPGNVYISVKYKFIKIGNLRVCWDLIQVNKSPISSTMTYQIAI